MSMKKNVLFVLLAWLTVLLPAAAQTEITGYPEIVNATTATVAGDTLYVGGSAALQVGDVVDNGVRLDLATGAPDTRFPGVNGRITTVIADGDGGWYIGGEFTQVGTETRNGLARIHADGTLDAWNPDAGSAPSITAILLANNGKVYLLSESGHLGTVGGVTDLTYLAAVDAQTGAVDASFNPPISYHIHAMAVSATTLYIGGGFNFDGYMAAFDLTTHALKTTWTPTVSGGQVYSLAVSGNTLYAGGNFLKAKGTNDAALQNRDYACAFDATTGALNAWKSLLVKVGSAIPYVNVILADPANDLLYMGGKFQAAMGDWENINYDGLAAYRLSTGALTPLFQNYIFASSAAADPSGDVSSLAVEGSKLYVGARLREVRVLVTTPSYEFVSYARSSMAAFDIDAVNLTATMDEAWVNANTDTQSAVELAISNGALYAGGSFHVMGRVFVHGIAAFNTTTKALLDVTIGDNTPATGYQTLAVQGNTLYAAGGMFQATAVAFNRTTGVKTWSLASYTPLKPITAMVVRGNKLIVNGGLDEQGLVALDLTRNNESEPLVSGWEFGVSAGSVESLVLEGDMLYAGSSYPMTINGQSRSLVSFDLSGSTPALRAWAPAVPERGQVNALAVGDGKVYTNGIAYDAVTGAATDFDLGYSDIYILSALVVDKVSNTLYAAGSFTEINGVQKNGLAAFDLNSDFAIPMEDWTAQGFVPRSSGSSLYLHDHTLYAIGSNFKMYDIGVSDKTPQTIDWGTDVVDGMIRKPKDIAGFTLPEETAQGLPITYSVTPAEVATVEGNIVTIAGLGEAVITATQEGSERYRSLLETVQLVVTNQTTPVISFAVSDKNFGDAPFDVNATSTIDLPIVYTTTSDKIRVSGKTITILQAGRVSVIAMQEETEEYAIARAEASFCITPAKPVITVDGGNGLLTSSAAAGNQWYLNGTSIAGATGQAIDIRTEGSYTVRVTIDDCAGASSDPKQIIVTGIEHELSVFRLFPNPASDFIELDGAARISHPRVSDIAGRTHIVAFEKTDKTLRGDIRHLPSGLYVLTVGNAGKLRQIKFVKK